MARRADGGRRARAVGVEHGEGDAAQGQRDGADHLEPEAGLRAPPWRRELVAGSPTAASVPTSLASAGRRSGTGAAPGRRRPRRRPPPASSRRARRRSRPEPRTPRARRARSGGAPPPAVAQRRAVPGAGASWKVVMSSDANRTAGGDDAGQRQQALEATRRRRRLVGGAHVGGLHARAGGGACRAPRRPRVLVGARGGSRRASRWPRSWSGEQRADRRSGSPPEKSCAQKPPSRRGPGALVGDPARSPREAPRQRPPRRLIATTAAPRKIKQPRERASSWSRRRRARVARRRRSRTPPRRAPCGGSVATSGAGRVLDPAAVGGVADADYSGSRQLRGASHDRRDDCDRRADGVTTALARRRGDREAARRRQDRRRATRQHAAPGVSAAASTARTGPRASRGRLRVRERRRRCAEFRRAAPRAASAALDRRALLRCGLSLIQAPLRGSCLCYIQPSPVRGRKRGARAGIQSMESRTI